MRSRVLLLFVGLTVGACSSGTDDGNNGAGVTPANTPDLNLRVATMSTEVDGVPRFLFEYDYDSLGRILTITEVNLATGDNRDVTTFTYGPDGIISRSNMSEMETFSYQNGRISQIDSDSRFGDNFSYTYDASGRLTDVVGDAFFSNDDCDVFVGIDGVDLPAPTYQLAYTGDRLSNITGSAGDVTTISYNAQGKITTLSTVNACDGDGTTTVNFAYDSNGRPMGASTREIFGEDGFIDYSEELAVSYSNGRLSLLEVTSADSTFSENSTTSYSYDAQGLLTMAVVNSEETFNGTVDSTAVNVSFTYEEGRCAGQRTAYPHRAIFLALQPSFQPGDSALDCVYALDNF